MVFWSQCHATMYSRHVDGGGMVHSILAYLSSLLRVLHMIGVGSCRCKGPLCLIQFCLDDLNYGQLNENDTKLQYAKRTCMGISYEVKIPICLQLVQLESEIYIPLLKHT